jgi:DNA-binding protein HU-beta
LGGNKSRFAQGKRACDRTDCDRSANAPAKIFYLRRKRQNSIMATGTAKKKMSKTQLATELGEATSTNKKTAASFLESLNEIAYREVKKNGEFTIPGIGKLVMKKTKARMGRNPKTGEAMKIAAKTVVRFRVAKAAKDSVLPKK